MSANQHTSLEAEAAVRQGFLFPVFVCLLFLLVLAGCALPLGEDWRIDVKKGEETGTNTNILNYDLQSYVPVPTAGEVPVKEFTGRRDLDVKVVWKDEGGKDITETLDVFKWKTVYQADITLTTKNGYTFDPAVSFAYPDGAVDIKPDPNTDAGVRALTTVTYKAAEPPVPVTDFDLTPYLAGPVTGGTPGKAVEGVQYWGWVEWSDENQNPVEGLFQAGTSYTAKVTLTAASGWTFGGVEPNAFTHDGALAAADPVDTPNPANKADSGVVNIVFKTGVPLVFSGSSSVEGDSAIDAIKAAKKAVGWTGVSLAWDGANQEVSLAEGTDLATTGLVLMNDPDPDKPFDPFTNNSPAEVIIDGLWPGREVALTGTNTNRAPLITVGTGVTLTLKNITFKGMEDTNNAPLIQVNTGGTLILESGARLTDNKGINGGGVFVNGGQFIMKGGTISENEAVSNGGGVYIHSGTFTMKGGTISENEAVSSGGGVYIHSGTFTMNGGTISGNEAYHEGGGVYVRSSSGATFRKTGGTIYGDDDSTHTPDTDENTSIDEKGHAVYIIYDDGNKLMHNSTAEPKDNLDSTQPFTVDGGWG
jgi:hypothetical protein